MEQNLCAESTLRLFRAKLELNDRFRKVFESSIEACRRAGQLKKKRLEVALDVQPSGDVLNVYVAASRGGVQVVQFDLQNLFGDVTVRMKTPGEAHSCAIREVDGNKLLLVSDASGGYRFYRLP